MSHAFLIYAPENVDDLLFIHERLRQAQIPTWYAPDSEQKDLNPEGLAKVVERSFCAVVLVSREAIKSKEVRTQFEYCQGLGLPIVPVIMEDFKGNNKLYKQISEYPVIRQSKDADTFPDRLLSAVRSHYESTCPVVAVMNLKGGVGKTTVSAQVFGELQKLNKNRVLLLDLDPQYNLTQYFLRFSDADKLAEADASVISMFEPGMMHSSSNVSPGEIESWDRISERLFVPLPVHKLRQNILVNSDLPGQLDIIPGQFEISKYAFSTDMEGVERARENFLAAVQSYRRDYDLIVIDTNPNATFLNRVAFDAANHVLAPIRADAFSLRGIRLLTRMKTQYESEDNIAKIHLLFNGVQRNEASTFEADVRDGRFDTEAKLPISKHLLEAALPQSGHLTAKLNVDPQRPWQRLATHYARGGGISTMRRALEAIAMEMSEQLGVRSYAD